MPNAVFPKSFGFVSPDGYLLKSLLKAFFLRNKKPRRWLDEPFDDHIQEDYTDLLVPVSYAYKMATLTVFWGFKGSLWHLLPGFVPNKRKPIDYKIKLSLQQYLCIYIKNVKHNTLYSFTLMHNAVVQWLALFPYTSWVWGLQLKVFMFSPGLHFIPLSWQQLR